MDQLQLTSTYVVITCAQCAMHFATPKHYDTERRREHDTFFCPRGHRNYYPHETDEERLRRERDAARARATHALDQLEATKRSRAAIRGQLTKVRTRAAAGVCPFGCKRHFTDLQRHVETKHPEQVGRSTDS